MASQALNVGQSISIPPYFNGNDNNYWKARMRIYLKSIDLFVWNIVENEYTTPIITVEGVDVPNPADQWNEENMKHDNKCKSDECLVCALSPKII